MFGSGKKLDGDCILRDLMKITDEPRVIGKPGPTAKTMREMLEKANAIADIEKECLDRNLALGKVLDN